MTRDNLIYASAAKGFRPGGPNRFQINPVLCAADLNQLGLSKAPDTFDSDNLWSYELGTKNQFGNIMFNGALFYTDWKKIQQQINLTSCGFAFTGNAGAAHVKGAEAEARINLTRAFQVGGTATYSDAKIVEAVPGTTAEDGDQVLAVPKWMLSGYASYGAELIEGWRGQIRGEYQYQSRSRRQFNRTLAILYPSGAAGTTPNRADSAAPIRWSTPSPRSATARPISAVHQQSVRQPAVPRYRPDGRRGSFDDDPAAHHRPGSAPPFLTR
ncbi:TonB-dependent receptor domain-containing protein [Rhizorhabdus histidinilytica]